MTSSKPIVVDGSNVAHMEFSHAGDPRIANIVAVRKVLEDKGYDPIVVVDASLRYKIDDPDQLEALMDEQKIRQAPSETEADYFILETAEKKDAPVVSNDEYDKYQDQHPWIDERRVPLMIVDGEVELDEPELEG